MGKYFGTDGVRGVANTELAPEFTLKFGRILGYQLTSLCERPKVLIGRVQEFYLGAKQYVDYIESTISGRLNGLKVVLDCANGASSALAPQLFKELGAEVIAVSASPDGININE